MGETLISLLIFKITADILGEDSMFQGSASTYSLARWSVSHPSKYIYVSTYILGMVLKIKLVVLFDGNLYLKEVKNFNLS